METKGIGSTYFGKSGHLFVMSELLLRGWNVAIPEIDQGDDIFVVKHGNTSYRRMQVKSANARINKKSISVQFYISKAGLFPSGSEVDFAFLVRYNSQWMYLFIIQSDELRDLVEIKISESSKALNLTITISGTTIVCRQKDFKPYL